MKKEQSHPSEEVVDMAVRNLMDDILEGIVKTFPDNPTIPADRSGANTPSTLYVTVSFDECIEVVINLFLRNVSACRN